MSRKVLLVSVAALLLLVQGAAAKERKFEITPTIGYTFSEGVTTAVTDIGDDLLVDEVYPESGMSYGVAADMFFRPDGMIGFSWSQQDSRFTAGLTDGRDSGLMDMKINNYHAIFTYIRTDLGEATAPFVFGGLGATQYTFSDYREQSVDSETKFSTTWGAGVRVYPAERVGIKFMGRWTPTYIKSDPEGVYCNYYYCYVLGDSQYSHQFELSGSLILRF
jgi:opacity protein-like surface antigen